MEKQNYLTPEVEVIEIAIEKGFAASTDGLDTEGLGDGGAW